MTSEQVEVFSKLITPKSGVEFESATLVSLFNPCVYMYVAANGEALYVGSSKNGIQRVLGRSDHVKAIRSMQECASLMMWQCATLELARQAEAFLITELHPKYNERGHLTALRKAMRSDNVSMYARSSSSYETI
jgi:hypothetical protein